MTDAIAAGIVATRGVENNDSESVQSRHMGQKLIGATEGTKMKRAHHALCLIAGAGLMFPCTAFAQKEAVVRIGHVAPLSGAQAHYGKDTENGVRMAIEDLNAQGVTIGGKKVRFQLQPEDDAADPKLGLIAAKTLCDAKVAGVVGHLNSATTIAASKVYNDCGIPQITGAASNPNLTKLGYKTTFRIIASDNTLGAGLASYAANVLKVKKVAILDDRTAYGRGMADVFKRTAQQNGIQVVDEQFTTDKANDFIGILTAIKAKAPDAIFFGGMDPQAGQMLRQMEQLGMSNMKYLGGDGICTSEIIKLVAGAKTLENVICVEGGASPTKTPGGAAWKKRYDAKFPGQFQIYSPYTYDATFVLADAMKRANSTDPKVYGPYLAGSEFQGVTGQVSFNSAGELGSPSMSVYSYRGQNKVLLASYSPPLAARDRVHVVTTFFATDRKIVSSSGGFAARFSNERSSNGDLSLGVAVVSIPPGHKMGTIERPIWWKIEFAPSTEKHVVLRTAEIVDPTSFFQSINNATGDAIRRSFIFVHGYNVSFEDAALRTAQLAVDLDIRAVPTFYSWPSQGRLAMYTRDWTNIEWTQPHLKKFLEQYADATKFDEIFVIAHSMGSNAAARALGELIQARVDLRGRFKELILAAPDIDAAVFKEQILPVFRQASASLTLYASSRDKALEASVSVHGAGRAGLGGAQILIAAGLETIDASDIDTDWLGHSVYAEGRPLLTDLSLLLKDGMRAQQRPSLREMQVGSTKYWRFRE